MEKEKKNQQKTPKPKLNQPHKTKTRKEIWGGLKAQSYIECAQVSDSFQSSCSIVTRGAVHGDNSIWREFMFSWWTPTILIIQCRYKGINADVQRWVKRQPDLLWQWRLMENEQLWVKSRIVSSHSSTCAYIWSDDAESVAQRGLSSWMESTKRTNVSLPDAAQIQCCFLREML